MGLEMYICSGWLLPSLQGEGLISRGICHSRLEGPDGREWAFVSSWWVINNLSDIIYQEVLTLVDFLLQEHIKVLLKTMMRHVKFTFKAAGEGYRDGTRDQGREQLLISPCLSVRTVCLRNSLEALLTHCRSANSQLTQRWVIPKPDTSPMPANLALTCAHVLAWRPQEN